MTAEAIALIIIAVFQAFQAILMSMGTFILKDLRDRVARLESIEMQSIRKT